jgi:drug/metabolite transporter (DMT)-like permease
MPSDADSITTSPSSRENLALGLGLAALASWVIAMIFAGENDDNGWLWVVMAALGLGALATGLTAGSGRPRGRALVGAVIGGLLVLLFLGFVIAGD